MIGLWKTIYTQHVTCKNISLTTQYYSTAHTLVYKDKLHLDVLCILTNLTLA